MNRFTTNHLFANEQHGFLPSQSCATQLLVAIEKWSEALDQGLPVDVIYLDFKKAFNSVPHHRLLSKFKSYGISGNLLAWIESFLKDRNQRVLINGVIDNQLTFHSHVSSISSKARKPLALIRQSFIYFDKETFPYLYKSIVQPTLEYGNLIWGPFYLLAQQKMKVLKERQIS